MTEKERMEIVFGIRQKLKMMNKKLQRLTKGGKYTTMGDIWREIDRSSPVAGKRDIVEAAATLAADLKEMQDQNRQCMGV